MNRKDHWHQMYERKATDDFSWFQPEPALSFCLLESAGLTSSS
jgi:hypothetical protein